MGQIFVSQMLKNVYITALEVLLFVKKPFTYHSMHKAYYLN